MGILQEEFYQRDLAFVGIQETRMRCTGVIRGNRYSAYSSAATPRGTHGVQLWVRNDFVSKVVAADSLSPRAIRVTLLMDGRRLHVFVLHAPTEAEQPEVKDAFWNMVDEQLASTSGVEVQDHRLLLIDANARLGSRTSSSVGPAGAVAENNNGARLHATLVDHRLYAMNTFGNGGAPTWVGTTGRAWRIDYVCADLHSRRDKVETWVDTSIDLATATRDDHFVICAKVTIQSPEITAAESNKTGKGGAPRKKKIPKLEHQYGSNLYHFQRGVAGIEPLDHSCNLDDEVQRIVEQVHSAACEAFEPQKTMPMKSWISHTSWEVVSKIAPQRRRLATAATGMRNARLSVAFRAWAVAKTATRAETMSGLDENAPSWCRQLQSLAASVATRAAAFRSHAWQRRILEELQTASRRLLKADKRKHIEDEITAASHAEKNGDARKVWQCIRKLSGKPPPALPGVRDTDGRLATSKEQCAEIWHEHFRKQFVATSVEDPAQGVVQRPRSIEEQNTAVVPSSDEILAVVASMPANKAVGPDGIAIEVWKAGGEPAMRLLVELVQASWRQLYVPWTWRGGRLVPLYKGKGPQTCPTSSRPLLIADHIAKVLALTMKSRVDEAYNAWVSRDQSGCTRHRGTDFATLTLRVWLQRAALLERSICAVFLDLSSAFDTAIREVLLGIEMGSDDAHQKLHSFLRSLGLDEEDASKLAHTIIERPPLLQDLGCSDEVIAMVRSLHSCSWFKIFEHTMALRVDRGGRQGCPLGAMLFNMCYAAALAEIQHDMLSAGCVLTLPTASPLEVFRGTHPDAPAAEPVAEATYVDDNVFMLEATSPTLLDKSIETLTRAICTRFRQHGLKVNFSAGKTEAMLVYRGRHAHRFYAKRRDEQGNEVIMLPEGAPAKFMHVVRVYKHLGGIVTANGSLQEEAARRTQQATAALTGITPSLLKSAATGPELRMRAIKSLVFSKLLYNVATWPALSGRQLEMLEVVHMRAIRRASRHTWSPDPEKPIIKDLQLRHALGICSLEHEVRKRRLLLFSRVLRHGSPALLALLASRPKGVPVPWMATVLNDLEIVRSALPQLSLMPSPSTEAGPWIQLLTGYPHEWRLIVATFVAHDSSVQKRAPKPPVPSGLLPSAQHTCDECQLAFKSRKALLQHARIKHGVTCEWARFVAGPACPACGKAFRHRLRVFTHLADTRPGRGGRTCADFIRAGGAPALPPEEVERLAAQDAADRAAARAHGHTQPLVQGSHR